MEVTEVDFAGQGGGRSQLPFVCVGGMCSLTRGGDGGSCQARLLALPFSPRNTSRSQLCGLRPVLPFWASVSLSSG